MARPKGSTKGSGAGGESIAPYWREYFQKNRHMLRIRSNKHAYKTWLSDHPDNETVPEQWRTGLGNVKSNMRSKRRKRRSKAEMAAEGMVAVATIAKAKPVSVKDLVKLEVLIDDCITLAHNLDKETLGEILNALRVARRRVVLMGGEE